MRIEGLQACWLGGVVLLLAGCPRYDPNAQTVNTPPAANPTPVVVEPVADDEPAMLIFAKATSADETFVVRYAVRDGVVPLNETFDLVVTVWDNTEPQRPATDVTIEIDGRMPHHQHGMNRVPVITEVEPGRFEIEGMLFHMPGYWEIHVDVTRQEVTERAHFEVNLE